MLSAKHDLWSFACEVYSHSVVSNSCLELQDRYGIEVPLLLFCVWSGWRYGELSNDCLQQASEFSRHYSKVTVEPLRAVRREMKGAYISGWPLEKKAWLDLRENVKSLELNSEKICLEGLARLAAGMLPVHEQGSAVEAGFYNIRYCFPCVLKSTGPTLVDLLVSLLGAIYNESEDSVRLRFDEINLKSR